MAQRLSKARRKEKYTHTSKLNVVSRFPWWSLILKVIQKRDK
jgi:hypothetical protein